MTYDSKVKVKIFAFRAIDRFLVYVALIFDHKVILAIWNLYFNQHIMSNYMCLIYTHLINARKRSLYYEQCDRFKEYLTLDFKVISIFWDFCSNLHMICKYCSKYEYARSKNEIGGRVLSRRQVLSISDLYLWLPDHISDVRPLFRFWHYEQLLCNLESMMFLKYLMHANPL